jgi:hypothetical protein
VVFPPRGGWPHRKLRRMAQIGPDQANVIIIRPKPNFSQPRSLGCLTPCSYSLPFRKPQMGQVWSPIVCPEPRTVTRHPPVPLLRRADARRLFWPSVICSKSSSSEFNGVGSLAGVCEGLQSVEPFGWEPSGLAAALKAMA